MTLAHSKCGLEPRRNFIDAYRKENNGRSSANRKLRRTHKTVSE